MGGTREFTNLQTPVEDVPSGAWTALLSVLYAAVAYRTIKKEMVWRADGPLF